MDLYRWLRAQWDRTAAVAAALLGALALLLGWVGVSGATLPTEQLPYIASGGLFGMFALGVGATLWLSADLRDEWRKLDEIHKTLLDPEGAGNAHRVVEERSTDQRPAEHPRHVDPGRADTTVLGASETSRP